jgi:copper homeostasis protein
VLPIAVSGLEQIRGLVKRAGTRIEVMPGAGLTPENVAGVVDKTGVKAVHSSCSSAVPHEGDVDSHACALGFIPANDRMTDPAKVAAMLRSLDALG